MANDKMTYQRANRLKNVGLGKLMVDRIVSGQGVGRSIKSAISDKTTARVTRMKAKFDPMNIGKMFGGRLGAYAVGKMTGRREEDLAYFTGARVRASSMENMKVNPLVTKVSDGDQSKMKKNDGLADVMARIYNLIKNNSEEQKRQLDIDKNLNIDREKQREKWHSDLIHALTGVGGKTTTAEPAKKAEGFFDGIFDFVKNMVENSIKGVMSIIENLKTLIEPVLKFFNSVATYVKPLLEFLGSKFFALITGPAGLLGVSTFGALAALLFLAKNEKEKIEADPNAPEYKDNPYAMTLRGEAETIGQATAINQRKAVKQFPRKQVEDFVNSDFTDTELKAELGGDRQTLKKWLVDNPKPNAMYQAPVAPIAKTATPLPAGVKPSTAGAGRGSADFAAVDPRRIDKPVTEVPKPKTASPIPPAPDNTGTRVQSAINTNNDMNLDQGSSKTVLIDNSKTVNASGGSSGPAISMDSSVLVRTDDPTLQNVLKKITRQV